MSTASRPTAIKRFVGLIRSGNRHAFRKRCSVSSQGSKHNDRTGTPASVTSYIKAIDARLTS